MRIDWFDLLLSPLYRQENEVPGKGGRGMLIWPFCTLLERVRTGIQIQGPNFKAKLPPLYPHGGRQAQCE